MNKMRLYSVALQHKQEIMKYVMNDSVAIHKIHRKFERAVRDIVQDVHKHRGPMESHKYNFS